MTTMRGEARKEILENFLRDVWSGGMIDRCDRYLAGSYTIHHDPGDPWEGQCLTIAAFRERVRLSRAPFPDQRFHVQQLFVDDAAVVATWRWSATHLGDLPGFPATGKPLGMSGATVYYFDDRDQLTGHWQIADRLGIFRQLREAAS